MAIAALMAIGSAPAQIVTTTSSQTITIHEQKPPRIKPKFEWYVKAGLNLMNTHFRFDYNDPSVEGSKTLAGFNAGFGTISHFRPSNPSDFYWGFELGISQVGGGFEQVSVVSHSYSTSDYSKSMLSFYVGPTLGWKKALTNSVKLDLHFNPEFVAIPSAGEDEIEFFTDNSSFQQYIDASVINMGFRGGVGVWFNKFNVDLSYRYITDFDSYDNEYKNIILSVGYNF